jgi:RNA polymerase primary sigma factor
MSLDDHIEDNHALSPAELASMKALGNEFLGCLETLSKEERAVIELRFGLTDGNRRTVKAVGRIFQLSSERIREIELKVLRTMRRRETGRFFGAP